MRAYCMAPPCCVCMRSIGFGMRPDSTPLTASVGIAERNADAVTDWKVLVDLADQRMYLAKQGGRDRVVGRHETS